MTVAEDLIHLVDIRVFNLQEFLNLQPLHSG